MTRTLAALFVIATRSVVRRRANLLLALLLSLSTLLLVVVSAIWAPIERSTRRVFTDAFIGDAQVFAQGYADPGIFRADGLPVDAPLLPDVAALQDALTGHPNVREVVPMAFGAGEMHSRALFDALLEELRDQVKGFEPGAPVPGRAAALSAHVRFVAQSVLAEIQAGRGFYAPESLDEDLAALTRATSEDFWAGFALDPLGALEFLDNRVAPVVSGGARSSHGLSFLGAPTQQLLTAFPAIQISEGRAPGPGERGILLPRNVYEEAFKLRVVRRLEKLERELAKGTTIASSPELGRWVRDNREGTRELVVALGPESGRQVATALRAALRQEGGLEPLLRTLLDMTDANAREHARLFRAEVLPHLRPYSVPIGAPLMVSAQSDQGYATSARVPLLGTYELQGLGEVGEMLAEWAILDVGTLRELADLPPGGGAPPPPHEPITPTSMGEAVPILDVPTGPIEDRVTRTALESEPPRESEEQLMQGAARHAAVLLRAPEKLGPTLAELQSRCEPQGCAVVGWREAAGYMGYLITGGGLLLGVLVGAVYLLVLLLISNSTTILSVQREAEMGTLRAMGAQRGFLAGVVSLELLLLCGSANLAGAAGGAAVVQWLSGRGIGFGGVELLRFYFGGPTLRPTLEPSTLLVPVIIVLLVGLASMLRPTLRATHATPLSAMSAAE